MYVLTNKQNSPPQIGSHLDNVVSAQLDVMGHGCTPLCDVYIVQFRQALSIPASVFLKSTLLFIKLCQHVDSYYPLKMNGWTDGRTGGWLRGSIDI